MLNHLPPTPACFGTRYFSSLAVQLPFPASGKPIYGWPVILGGFTDQSSFGNNKWGAGTGHNWVCDGYIQTYYNGTGYLDFHMNWGWNNQYNGWFACNSWPIYTSSGTLYKNYQYCQDVVINIHS